MKLIIADYNNWEKTVDLDKAVIRIGSSPTSDVPLNSPDVAPTHLQFHYLPEEFGCKLLNLGTEVKIVRGEYQEVLQSYARTELTNGDEITLGEYRIRVKLPITTKILQASRSISASLSFPNTTLYPHTPTVGWLTVKNIGVESPCQFHVSVSGLPADCVKIDPIPLLYSGAQEEVRIQLTHHGTYPYAGLTELTIRVFAPSDYPGEQVIIEQGIYVTPVFEQTLDFVKDLDAEAAAPASSENAPGPNLVAQSTTSSVPPRVPPPPPPKPEPVNPELVAEAEDEPETPIQEEEPVDASEETEEATATAKESQPEKAPLKETVAALPKPEPKAVVVRDLPEEFWDESDD